MAKVRYADGKSALKSHKEGRENRARTAALNGTSTVGNTDKKPGKRARLKEGF